MRRKEFEKAELELQKLKNSDIPKEKLEQTLQKFKLNHVRFRVDTIPFKD